MFGKIITYFDELIILGFTKIGFYIDDIIRFTEPIIDEIILFNPIHSYIILSSPIKFYRFL